jgi:hypothetical protein
LERRQFVKESLALGFEREEVFELTKLAFIEAKDKDIEHDINSANQPEPKKKEEKKCVETTTDDKKTIHAVIMEGLRGGKDNTSLLIDLKEEHPEVDEKKLKQRIYEYRNHFNKGKIK